jgi:hypothetical protein
MRTTIAYYLLCLIFAVCSCTKDVSVSGEYRVEAKTINDQLFLRKIRSTDRIVGSELNLKSDSTFLYFTCGNEMTGHWRKIHESISLYVATNIYRSDSMRSKKEAIIPKEPIIFQIRQRQLYRFWDTTDSNRIVELLTKKIN